MKRSNGSTKTKNYVTNHNVSSFLFIGIAQANDRALRTQFLIYLDDCRILSFCYHYYYFFQFFCCFLTIFSFLSFNVIHRQTADFSRFHFRDIQRDSALHVKIDELNCRKLHQLSSIQKQRKTKRRRNICTQCKEKK